MKPVSILLDDAFEDSTTALTSPAQDDLATIHEAGHVFVGEELGGKVSGSS
jgi:hypothetical protein